MPQAVNTGSHDTPFRINDLPPELISQIFETLFLESHDGSTGRVPRNDHCPCFLSSSTIAQVSRSWRRISISTPLLWTHVHLLLELSTPFSPDHPNTVDICLDRSRSLPLFVEISFEWCRSSLLSSDVCEAALSRLFETVGRWRSLIIWYFFSDHQGHVDVLARWTSALRSLRHLEIHEWYEGDFPPATLAELPRLDTLLLQSSDPTIVLPWGQIKELTTDSELISLKVLECSLRISSLNLGMLYSASTLPGPVSSAPFRVTDSLTNLIVNPRLSRYIPDAVAEFPGLKCLAQTTPSYSWMIINYLCFMQHGLCPLLAKAPLLQELHLTFSWSFSFRQGLDFVPIDFSTLLPSLKLFHLTFVLREEDYHMGSPGANGLLELLFGPLTNGIAHSGGTCTSAFLSPKMNELAVRLRIDPNPRPRKDGEGPSAEPVLRQGDDAQPLTQSLLRILSALMPQEQSCTLQKTFLLEYDTHLRGYLEPQRASFECLQTKTSWDIVVKEMLSHQMDKP